MKHETLCVEGIERLMDIFYAKIRTDTNGVGEIFNNAIGTSDAEWEAHKKKIANFWQGMLLGMGDYQGQPLKAHLDLPRFPREFFGIWLGLFEESLHQSRGDSNICCMRAGIKEAIAIVPHCLAENLALGDRPH